MEYMSPYEIYMLVVNFFNYVTDTPCGINNTGLHSRQDTSHVFRTGIAKC